MRSYRVRVHLDAELAIPFVPPFILAYLSMDLVFVAAPFILRSRRELEALALTLVMVTAVAGISFLLFPAELAYPHCDPSPWSALFTFAREIALPYNLVPSLHVAMSCICLAAYATYGGEARQRKGSSHLRISPCGQIPQHGGDDCYISPLCIG
jgi:hypothetical protein